MENAGLSGTIVPVKTTIIVFTLSILLCAAARAELKWEQTQLELHPAVGDKGSGRPFQIQEHRQHADSH